MSTLNESCRICSKREHASDVTDCAVLCKHSMNLAASVSLNFSYRALSDVSHLRALRRRSTSCSCPSLSTARASQRICSTAPSLPSSSRTARLWAKSSPPPTWTSYFRRRVVEGCSSKSKCRYCSVARGHALCYTVRVSPCAMLCSAGKRKPLHASGASSCGR